MRLPSVLADALTEAGFVSRRSRNSEIVFRLQESLRLEEAAARLAILDAAVVEVELPLAGQRDAAALLVTEPHRDAAAPLYEEPPAVAEGSVARVERKGRGSVGVTPSRVASVKCPRVQFHRRGEWCKYCEWSG